MTPVILYIRFSTKRQEKGASRDRQLEDCHAFAERKGWTVVEVIEDLGRSAWSGEHLRDGKLGDFARRVERGDIPQGTVLLVEKLDRLSRQEPKKTQRWMEDKCEAGISIATVSGDRVYTDESLRANLMETFEILMRAKLAHDESQQKSERVSDKIVRNIERAKTSDIKISAKCPGWLTLNTDRRGFTVIEERVEIVRLIYQLSAEGRGPGWIAKTLNERGIEPWSKWRKPGGMAKGWEITQTKLILRQPAVEGDYVTGFSNTHKDGAGGTKIKDVIHGYYPRIVDADLVARARASLDGRKTGGGRYRCEVSNLFAGLVRCSHCNGRLNVRVNQGGVRYFQCLAATRARGCDKRAMYRYDEFETACLDAVLAFALSDRFFERPDVTLDLARELATKRKTAADLQEGTQRLTDAIVMNKITSPTMLSTIGANETKIVALTASIADLESRLKTAHGAVSPADHVARVLEVRGALNHPDRETRQSARLRVQESLKSVIECIFSDEDDELVDGRRSLTVILGGGAHTMKFAGGKLVADGSCLGGEDNRKIMAMIASDPAMMDRLKNYIRRGRAMLGAD